jgi:hypothetical protein
LRWARSLLPKFGVDGEERLDDDDEEFFLCLRRVKRAGIEGIVARSAKALGKE